MKKKIEEPQMYVMRIQMFNEILVVAFKELDIEKLREEAKLAYIELPEKIEPNMPAPYYWNLAKELHIIVLPVDFNIGQLYHEVMHMAFALMDRHAMDPRTSTGQEVFNSICEEIIWRVKIDILKERPSNYQVFREL